MADTKAGTHTPWRGWVNDADPGGALIRDAAGHLVCTIAGESCGTIPGFAVIALIVRSVNCHQELVDALRLFMECATAEQTIACQVAESAIRRAEGKEWRYAL